MRQLTHVGSSRQQLEEQARAAARVPAKPPANLPDLDGASQPCAPAALVRIYEMEKEWGFSYWLCPTAAAEMVSERWSIRKHRAPPFDDLPCYRHGHACPGRDP